MSLTISSGPLAGKAPDSVNYRIEGPAHRLLMQEFPRRVRAVFGGATVFDTTRAMLLHETGILPQLYIPEADIRQDLLRPTETHTVCPYKGTASYWTVLAGGKELTDAVWSYPAAGGDSAKVSGYLSFLHDDLVVEAG